MNKPQILTGRIVFNSLPPRKPVKVDIPYMVSFAIKTDDYARFVIEGVLPWNRKDVRR